MVWKCKLEIGSHWNIVGNSTLSHLQLQISDHSQTSSTTFNYLQVLDMCIAKQARLISSFVRICIYASLCRKVHLTSIIYSFSGKWCQASGWKLLLRQKQCVRLHIVVYIGCLASSDPYAKANVLMMITKCVRQCRLHSQ